MYKVAVGTVLQIAPGVTYEVPPQLSVPTDRQNYGDILKDLTGARIDYGHILDSTGINCPFGSLGTIGNNAEHRFLRNTVGTNALGGLITITGASEIFFTPPYIVEGGFVIQGAAKTTFSLLHPSEGGTIAAFSGAAETVRWSPDEEQLLFTTKGAATTLFSLLHPGSGLIRVTPGVDQARAARPPAGGFIDISGGAVEAFIANPPEEQVLFRFTGVLGESFTPASHIGEGVLFNFNGSSELLTFAEQPEVNIRISGAAVTVRVPNHIGSGSLFALSGAAESFTANPEERQLLSPSLELLQSPLLQHQKLDLDLRNFLVQLHQKSSHLQSNHSEQSLFLEMQKIASLHNILVLVHCLHSMVLQKQLDSIRQKKHHYSSLLENLPKRLSRILQKREQRSNFLEIQLPRFSPLQSNHSVQSLYLEMQKLQDPDHLLVQVLSENYLVLPNLSHSTQTRSKCSSRSREELPTNIPNLTSVWIHQSDFAEVHSATSKLTTSNQIGMVLEQSEYLAKQIQFTLQYTLVLVHSRSSLVQQNLSLSIQTRSKCSSPSQENLQKEQQHLMLARAIYSHSVVEQKELHMHLLYSQISESMAKSVFVMYLTTLDLVTSSTLVVLLSLSPSTQMKDNYYSPLLVR